jgi:dienelactone hydrolase
MRNAVSPPRSSPALSIVAAVFLALPSAPAHAEPPKSALILFKDGFSLQGYVIREKKTITDSATGMPVQLPEGFFLVDDLARRVIFSPSRLAKVIDDQSFQPESGVLVQRRSKADAFARPVPPIRQVLEAGPFNEKWDRTYRYNTTDREVVVPQHLSALSPYYARVDAMPLIRNAFLRQYRWMSFYLTRELGAEQVRALLVNHPDLRESKGMKEQDRADRRLRVAQFLLRCGWYDETQKELDQFAQDFPNLKSQTESLEEQLKKSRATRRAQEVRLAYQANRFGWLERHLADFDEDGLDEQTAADVRALRSQLETAAENVKLAQRYLKELPSAVFSPGQRAWLAEAAEAIRVAVAPDNVGRLEAFLGQARQAERQRQQEKQPDVGPAPLLALAVSGWLLGNTAAETNVDIARRLWATRQFVLHYEKASSAVERRQMLEDYESRRSDAVPLDEMVQLIRSIPPPDAEDKPDPGPRDVAAPGGGYCVQLPPEYGPRRTYPVLIALHGAGETPKDAVAHWGETAAQHGYIVAAPKWAQGLQAEYEYSVREHAAVLGTLRDLRRRFQVDSDRVFLAGLGPGGDMAYDVGLSHPDLFAGVVPMGAFPGPFPYRYRHNGQYLPFYVVTGDRSGDSADNRAMFKEWVAHGYPSLFVQYRGRGLEWFGAELPSIFDWMDRQRRANPISELGRWGQLGDQFETMRATDNHFYWLSTDSIRDSCLNDGPHYSSRILGATLQANRGGNHINVRTQGINRVTVWLGTGEGSVDFDKPVAIYVGTALRWNRKVEPSREVLLDDLLTRGDRQRLYVARVDLDGR